MTQTFIVRSLAEWSEVFDQLLEVLKPGMVLALSGPLGAGKTTCTQVLLKRLGGQVQAKSPTFALMRSYRVDHSPFTRMLHIDAYRLEREEDVQVLALEDELSEPGTIAVIEWPEQMADWMVRHAEQVVWLTIKPTEDETREVTLEYRT